MGGESPPKQKETMFKKLLLLLCIIFVSCDAKRYINLHCLIKPLHLEKRINAVYISHPMIKYGHEKEISANWSGYVLLRYLNEFTPESIRTVWGTWTIPLLQATEKDSFCSIWMGMDGYDSKTMEQIGTAHSYKNGKQENFVWFQLYPDTPYEILDFPIEVGDSISGSIVTARMNGFDMRIFNNTKKCYTKVPMDCTQSFNAKRSSAQWVVEPLTINSHPQPLANFGTIKFTECTATVGGYYGSINENSMGYHSIAMLTNRSLLNNMPSVLSDDGKSFSIQWKKE